MPPKADQSPATWADALSSASQALAAGLSAPDADVKFGLAMLGAMATHRQRQGSGPGGAAGPGGPAGGGGAGSPPAGMPGSPGGGLPPQVSPSGGPPPGVSPAAGPAGGGAPNSAMPSTAAPGAPIPGGMTPGLSPNPDELRRVLSDVAGQ